jgi:hypothetical protein
MNPAPILMLIGDLYEQLLAATARADAAEAALAEARQEQTAEDTP